ncbi:MAG: FAD-dependent oxidoreductase, partial [Burkholderiales bacterium]
MWQLFRKRRMWRTHDLKPTYDVVIVGAGVHGLALAYYLGKRHGIRRVALLDKGYLGSGNSGRNTAILRSNYRTPEGIPFYHAALSLYEEMSRELDWNVMFSQCGHLTLAHTDSGVAGLRLRAENNRLLGVASRLIFRDEIRQLEPGLDASDRPRYPIMAALYHPPGGVIRHDAVVWGYARACDRLGIEIHPFTEVTGIRLQDRKVCGVVTTRGEIRTQTVVNAAAGWATTIARMAGVRLPIVTHPLQACVTEPLKPLLNHVIVSANLHVYVNQSDRGELVMGAEIDPYQSYSMKATLPTLEQIASSTLELFP